MCAPLKLRVLPMYGVTTQSMLSQNYCSPQYVIFDKQKSEWN